MRYTTRYDTREAEVILSHPVSVGVQRHGLVSSVKLQPTAPVIGTMDEEVWKAAVVVCPRVFYVLEKCNAKGARRRRSEESKTFTLWTTCWSTPCGRKLIRTRLICSLTLGKRKCGR